MSATLQLTPPRSRTVAEPTFSTLAHLVFLIDSQCYACPAADIAHLMLLSDAQLRPSTAGAPAWVIGRVQTQASQAAVPIISMRRLWNLPALKDDSLISRQSLLMVNLADKPCALLVDNCQCVLTALPAKAPSLHLPAALTGTMGAAFKTAISWKDTLLVIIDIKQLLPDRPKPGSGFELNGPTFP